MYNESVTAYNTIIRQIPDVVVTNQLHYERRELFEAAEGELEDVDVSELFSDRGQRPNREEALNNLDPDASA